MNKVIICGRLTRDPDVRYTQGQDQMCIARYTVAVDRRGAKEGGQTADFISCTAFQKAGEFAEKYLRQGTKVIVVGRIATGSYTDREGRKVYTTDVVVEETEFAESKKATEGSGVSGKGSGSPAKEPAVDADGFMTIPDGMEDEWMPFN